MDVEFADDDLDRLETDLSFRMGLPDAVVKSYRRRMQSIRDALDERDYREMRSLHFEKMKGSRAHQYSIRLNDQFRLMLELLEGSPAKTVRIVAVEDYH